VDVELQDKVCPDGPEEKKVL